MTVKELIQKLQEIENQDTIVVITNFDLSLYDKYPDIKFTTIPETLKFADEFNKEVKQINSLVIFVH